MTATTQAQAIRRGIAYFQTYREHLHYQGLAAKGSEVADPYPGKHQEARVVNHPRQVLLPAPPIPPDPLAACRQGFGRHSQQDTAQPSTRAGLRKLSPALEPAGADDIKTRFYSSFGQSFVVSHQA